MTAEIVIQKLKSIGYQIRIDGQDILLTADHDPDPELATSLLADLKQCKAEAVRILQGKSEAWSAEVQSLIDWYVKLDTVGIAPFHLEPHIYVADPVKFFASMRQEILTGPKAPRARTGALQADLRKLKKYLH